MSTRILPRPTDQYPERAIVSTITARAVFYTPQHARRYTQHPGSLPHLADQYLLWRDGQRGQEAPDR